MINVQTIYKKTFELYSKYGIKSVSVDDIARMLSISKKMLYEHITNRENLVQNTVENNTKEFLERLNQQLIIKEDTISKLCRFYAYLIKKVQKVNPVFSYDLKKYYPIPYQSISELSNKILYEEVKKIIKKGIEEGIFREDLNLKYIYFNQVNKISSLGVFLTEDQYAIPSKTLYQLILNDIRGITTLKGYQKLDAMYDKLIELIKIR